MSINASSDLDITVLDHGYDDDMRSWAERNCFAASTDDEGLLHVKGDYECSYMDGGFESAVDFLADLPAPPAAWKAKYKWCAEEGATVDGNSVIVLIEGGQVSHLYESEIVFREVDAWDWVVDEAKQLAVK